MAQHQRYLLSIYSSTTFAWWRGLYGFATTLILAEVVRLSGALVRCAPALFQNPHLTAQGPTPGQGYA